MRHTGSPLNHASVMSYGPRGGANESRGEERRIGGSGRAPCRSRRSSHGRTTGAAGRGIRLEIEDAGLGCAAASATPAPPTASRESKATSAAIRLGTRLSCSPSAPSTAGSASGARRSGAGREAGVIIAILASLPTRKSTLHRRKMRSRGNHSHPCLTGLPISLLTLRCTTNQPHSHERCPIHALTRAPTIRVSPARRSRGPGQAAAGDPAAPRTPQG